MAKIVHELETIETNFTGEVKEFSIEVNENLFHMLTDSLYARKHESIVRELFSNAQDAHAMNGKQDVPFSVTLPTQLSQEFVLRDYGPGISKENIYDVYIRYAKSTKGETNEQIGRYGLGSKTPLCLYSSFNVRSFHNGVVSSYCIFLNEKRIPSILQVADQPCGDETGLEVSFTCARGDVTAFTDAIKKVCRFYKVRPEVNQKLQYDEPKIKHVLKHGKIMTGCSVGILQGQLYYDVDLDTFIRAIQSQLPADSVTSLEQAFLNSLKNSHALVLDTAIGDIELSVSRESIQYTKLTCASILKAIKGVHEELQQEIEALRKIKHVIDFRQQLQAVIGKYYSNAYYSGAFILKHVQAKFPKMVEDVKNWNDLSNIVLDIKRTADDKEILAAYDPTTGRMSRLRDNSWSTGTTLSFGGRTVEIFIHDLESKVDSRNRVRKYAKEHEKTHHVFLSSYTLPAKLIKYRKTSELPKVKVEAAQKREQTYRTINTRYRRMDSNVLANFGTRPVYFFKYEESKLADEWEFRKHVHNNNTLPNFLSYVKHHDGSTGNFHIIVLKNKQQPPKGAAHLPTYLKTKAEELLQNQVFLDQYAVVNNHLDISMNDIGYHEREKMDSWLRQWRKMLAKPHTSQSQMVQFLQDVDTHNPVRKSISHDIRYLVQNATYVFAWLKIKLESKFDQVFDIRASYSSLLAKYPMLKYLDSSAPLSEVLEYVSMVESKQGA